MNEQQHENKWVIWSAWFLGLFCIALAVHLKPEKQDKINRQIQKIRTEILKQDTEP